MEHQKSVTSLVGGTWESLVYGDLTIRLDALMTAKALAHLSNEQGECRISIRSLADAVAYRDKGGKTIATVQRGLKGLSSHGYVMRLNPDAPRAERGHYRLTVPAVRLAAA